MADSKSLFLRNAEDVKAALLITKSPIFDKMIAFARAEFSQLNPSLEQCIGANKFIDVLVSIADEQAQEIPPLDSGLHHDLSIPDREPKPIEPK